jgi:hypothetical protein
VSYNEIAKAILTNNLNKGFWPTKPLEPDVSQRNFGEIVALIHSEISETYEAFDKGEKDDKLTDLSGFVVELADTRIRILDTLCAYGEDIDERVSEIKIERDGAPLISDSSLFTTSLMYLNLFVSRALESHRKSDLLGAMYWLTTALIAVDEIAARFKIDVEGATHRKMAYNEARPYKHGKAY